jgi:ferredoxin-NADP reductase
MSDADVVFRDELDALAVRAGAALHYVIGDHATEDGARLLTAQHLRELVPDLLAREVYVCGPPAMTAAIAKAVRHAHVPRRHIHTERFAL